MKARSGKNLFFVPVVRPGHEGGARQEKLRRWSFVCMALVAVLAVTGVTMQTAKIYEIIAVRKSINDLCLDNELLKQQNDAIRIQLDFEKRESAIALKASQELGMVMPENEQIIVLPGYAYQDKLVELSLSNVR